MKYCRQCPSCSKDLCTNNKYYYKKAFVEQKKCVSCAQVGKQFTEEHRQNLSKNHADVSGEKNPFWGKKHSSKTREILSNANAGKDRFSAEYKKLLSEKMSGRGNPFFGKSHTEEAKNKLRQPKTPEHRRKLSIALKGRPIGKRYEVTPEVKKKMRMSAIKRLQKTFGKNVFLPNVNKKETEYFSSLEKSHGWDGIYYGKNGESGQFYIKNLGYWVDFYDPTRNIIVEYDETHHYNGDWTLIEKDVIRQEEIVKELNCEFYRYNEVLNTLTKNN